MKKLFSTLFLLVSIVCFSQDITGQWFGAINVQGTKLNFVFNITKTDDTYAATMDIPEQKAAGIPLSSISFQNPNLKMGIEMAGIEYIGTLNASNEIIGNFNQGGVAYPLNLSKTKADTRKPQEPTEFNYYVENVTFQNKKDNISLGGT